MKCRWILAGAVLAALAGCAGWREPPLPAAGGAERQWRAALVDRPWRLQGRIGVTGTQVRWHGHLRWQHTPDAERLVLSGPFGQGGAVIEARRGWLRLRYPDGRTLESHRPERLLREVLGVPVPLAALRYWVLGMAAPGPAASGRDPSGRLRWLRQAGWEIRYQRYGAVAAGALPVGLTLVAPNGVRLKLLIDRWELEDRERV